MALQVLHVEQLTRVCLLSSWLKARVKYGPHLSATSRKLTSIPPFSFPLSCLLKPQRTMNTIIVALFRLFCLLPSLFPCSLNCQRPTGQPMNTIFAARSRRQDHDMDEFTVVAFCTFVTPFCYPLPLLVETTPSNEHHGCSPIAPNRPRYGRAHPSCLTPFVFTFSLPLPMLVEIPTHDQSTNGTQ